MKRGTLKNRILACLTAPTLLLAAPLATGRAWEPDGAALFLSLEEDGAMEEFLSGTYFFGESTTAHLARRGGVLDTPRHRSHVWKDESGTRMLDRRILASFVDCTLPGGSVRQVSLEEALQLTKPPRLVLSFGLNGLLYFHKNQTAFLGDYRRLIQRVRELSPDTEIVIQSIYPVRENGVFTLPPETLNAYIEVLNTRLFELARDTDKVRFIDTARLLRDADGKLKKEYDSGDGIHLTSDAYRQILSCLAAALYKEEPI